MVNRHTSCLALVLVLLWGINWPIAFIALEHIPPITFRVLTLTLGGISLLVFCKLTDISVQVKKHELVRLLFSSLFNVVAWNILSVYAIIELNSARSAILAFTMPFWVMIIEWILGQHPTWNQRVAIGMSSLGIAGLMLSASVDPSFSLMGAAIMSCAALTWACGSIYVKRYPVAMPRSAFAGWVLLLGAAMMAFLLPLQPTHFLPTSLSWQMVTACGYAAFIGIGLCQACWFALLGKLGPIRSSLVLLAIPPVGVASSWLLIGAPVSLLDVASLVVLLCAALMNFPQTRSP